MMNSVYSKNNFITIALIASVHCLVTWGIASAQTETVMTETAAANPDSAQDTAIAAGPPPPFVYNRERPDPFFPFLTQEIMKAEAKAKAELTGTQRFEPAQLTLVAIVSGKRGLLAMVQDSSGVGYVLRKGTKIGETGEVIQITQNKVIIEQVKNAAGDRVSRKFEMLLSKEGEK